MMNVIDAIGNSLRDHYLNLSETLKHKPKIEKVDEEPNRCLPTNIRSFVRSRMCNSNALEWGKPILENVMEALVDPDTHLLGVYGSDDNNIKDTLIERVYRRNQRDNLFAMVLTATVTKKPDVRKIQQEIARQLGLAFNHKSKDKRAKELIERIKIEQKILIVLCDIYKRLDLGNIGIPYGADHVGCKILLTSMDKGVLSKHMHTQINFMV